MNNITCDCCGGLAHYPKYSTVKRVDWSASTNIVREEIKLELCENCFDKIENAAFNTYTELKDENKRYKSVL